MEDENYQRKTFTAETDGTRLVVSFNEHKDYRDKETVFVEIVRPGGYDSGYLILTPESTRELRDHLNELLGDVVDAEVVEDAPVDNNRATHAMEELAHQLSLVDWVSIDNLSEALDRFNK